MQIHQLLFEIVAPCSLFLFLFYWVVLYQGHTEQIPDSLFFHGLNNLFLLLEAVLTNVALISSHFLLVIFFTTLYTISMWIFGGLGYGWPYPVLTFSSNSLLYYIALPWLIMAMWYFYIGLVKLRVRLVAKREQRYTSLESYLDINDESLSFENAGLN